MRGTQGCKSWARCDTRSERCRATSRAVVLNKLVKIFHFYTALVTRAAIEHSALYHEASRTTTRAVARCSLSAKRQICKSHTNRCCTPVPCRILKVELVETFFRPPQIIPALLPSRPSVTEILLRRDEFQRRNWGKMGRREKLSLRNASRTRDIFRDGFSPGETSCPLSLPCELTRISLSSPR